MKSPIEKSLILIKPDGIRRGLVGEIIKRIESCGLKIIGLKMAKPSLSHIKKHYPAVKEHLTGMGNKTLNTYKNYGISAKHELGTDNPLKIGEMVHKWNIEFLNSGPILAIVVDGVHAIGVVRKLVGNTVPLLADVGTIRGDFSSDSPVIANANKRALINLIHASSDTEEAKREINHWFKKSELYNYKRSDEEIMF